jgi:phospholipase C
VVGAAASPACPFRAGALPRDTLPKGSPLGPQIPIDHFVVVMQENRSFDHYFQQLPGHGQPSAAVGPVGRAAGANSVGSRRPLSSLCVADVPHNVDAVHEEFGDGRLDGFLAAAGGHRARAVGYYTANDLPFYYAIASTFAIGDRYFSGLLGPTWPNRMMALSGTSFGHVDNQPPPPADEQRSLFHQLEEAGVSWAVYSEGTPYESDMFPRLAREKGAHFSTIEAFLRAASIGKLPSFAWVESRHDGVNATDEHPPADIQLGQHWVWRIVNAVLRSPAWKRTALIFTYDEHGGFFDHVVPPLACTPDRQTGRTLVDGEPFRFDRYGFRVPLVVISPYARPHYVSHEVYSHSSILRLVQARFGLPALTARDANSAALFDLFDFRRPAFAHPPEFEPPPVDIQRLVACRKQWTKGRKSQVDSGRARPLGPSGGATTAQPLGTQKR